MAQAARRAVGIPFLEVPETMDEALGSLSWRRQPARGRRSGTGWSSQSFLTEAIL